MMGFYPECPGRPDYTLTVPVFDEIVLHLDSRYYSSDKVVIRVDKKGASPYIQSVLVDGKKLNSYRIKHEDLTKAKEVLIITGK